MCIFNNFYLKFKNVIDKLRQCVTFSTIFHRIHDFLETSIYALIFLYYFYKKKNPTKDMIYEFYWSIKYAHEYIKHIIVSKVNCCLHNIVLYKSLCVLKTIRFKKKTFPYLKRHKNSMWTKRVLKQTKWVLTHLNPIIKTKISFYSENFKIKRCLIVKIILNKWCISRKKNIIQRPTTKSVQRPIYRNATV